MPIRIERKRTRGWKMPANSIYVGRPTKWGNPFEVSKERVIEGIKIARNEIAINLFTEYAKNRLQQEPTWLDELRGKNLACWCPLDQLCHADILLELANK